MKSFAIVTLFFLIVVIMGCKKEGCTDKEAVNYTADAKKDDGTCTYQTRVSFWFKESMSNTLIWGGVEILTMYFDDVAQGTIDPANWTPGPDCGGDDFNLDLNMGSEKSKTISWTARDQFGNLHSFGTFTIGPNDCMSIELN